MQTDAELVEAVLRGDRPSFAMLVQRHERAVMAAAMGILQDHHAAQDVAQDAFVSAYQQLGSLRDGALIPIRADGCCHLRRFMTA